MIKKLSYIFCTIALLLLSEFANSQNIELKIKGSDRNSLQKIDSIGYRKDHENLKQITNEVDSLVFKLKRNGFLDSSITSKTKKGDSLYIYHLKTGVQFKKLTIYFGSDTRDKLPKHFNNKDSITIPFSETKNFLNSLNEEMANNGKPLNSLRLRNIKKTDNLVTGL